MVTLPMGLQVSSLLESVKPTVLMQMSKNSHSWPKDVNFGSVPPKRTLDKRFFIITVAALSNRDALILCSTEPHFQTLFLC